MNDKIVNTLKHALIDMDAIDRLSKIAGAHHFTLLRAELTEALTNYLCETFPPVPVADSVMGCPKYRFFSKDYGRYFDVISINFDHDNFLIQADQYHKQWIDGINQLEPIDAQADKKCAECRDVNIKESTR